MLLGNAHIKIARRKARLKLHHARAFAHGGRDADQARVVRRHVAQPVAKHLGKSGFGRDSRFLQTHAGVELARPVVGHGVGLGQFITLPFFGNHMQKLRAFKQLEVFECGN